jgi:hypothetical protein
MYRLSKEGGVRMRMCFLIAIAAMAGYFSSAGFLEDPEIRLAAGTILSPQVWHSDPETRMRQLESVSKELQEIETDWKKRWEKGRDRPRH